MANTLADGTSKQIWVGNAQKPLRQRLVAQALTNVETGPERIYHNPYGSRPAVSDGVAATAYTITDFVQTDDTFTVNRRVTSAEHIDNIERLQTRADLAQQRAEMQGFEIQNTIDKYVLNLPVSLSGVQDLDAGTIATGTASGVAYQITNSTIDDMANFIQQSLQLNDVTGDGAFWVVSPFESGILASYLQNNGDVYKDFAIKNGYVGSPFAGLDIYVSNNLTHSATLGMATQPTAGDTVTINGVVFTFVASIGSTAGNVLIGANVDVTRASLVAAVNGAAGAGTTYVEVGNDLYGNSNRLKLQRAQITATNDNTADTMAVTTLGTLVVSKSLTAGGDVWTSVTRHSIAGIKGSITLAIPSDGMEFKNIEVSGKHGREIETSQIYNGTIWSQLRPQVFDVVIKS